MTPTTGTRPTPHIRPTPHTPTTAQTGPIKHRHGDRARTTTVLTGRQRPGRQRPR